MRAIFIALTFSFLLSFNLLSQDKPTALIKGESASVSENLIKVELGLPNMVGLSYEKKIKPNVSIYSSFGFLPSIRSGILTQLAYGVNTVWTATPQLTVQPRFYHNLSKRAASDKNIHHNAANYVGLSGRLYHTAVAISNVEESGAGRPVFDLMLSYGFQRSFFKRLNWDMAIQPAIEFYDGQASFFIGFNLQLGFIVFSR